MKNNEPITSKHSVDKNSRIEEEDLWDIDDWDNSSEAPAETGAQLTEADAEMGDQPDNGPKKPISAKDTASTKNVATDEKKITADALQNHSNEVTESPTADTGSNTRSAEVTDKLNHAESEPSADTLKHASAADPENLAAVASPAKKLSSLEIAALGVFFSLMIGAAIYSYIGLNKINPSEDSLNLSLPVTGDQVTVSAFDTFWLSAEDYPDSKIGVTVMPAASITLDPATSQSGALRVYFRNNDKEIVGDTITLVFANGKFVDNQEAHTQIQDGGATARVISSDGLYEEGDYRAYMLDPNLVWQVHVSEGASELAAGDSFKEIIHTKVSTKRQ